MNGNRLLFHSTKPLFRPISAPSHSVRTCRSLVYEGQRRAYSTSQNLQLDDWNFTTYNIRPTRSGFGSHANPNFCKVQVTVASPPGVYYPTSLGRRSQDNLGLTNLVSAHFHASRTVQDLAASLGPDVRAQFPKSRGLVIGFSPDIRGRFVLDGLNSASCKFKISDVNPKTNTAHQSWQVKTEWKLRTSKEFVGKPVYLVLVTRETPAPGIDDQVERDSAFSDHALTDSSKSHQAELGQIHPTYYIHQELVTAATARQGDLGEAAALHIAKLVFASCDKRYKDKRLFEVDLGVKEIQSETTVPTLGCRIRLKRNRYEQIRASMTNGISQAGCYPAYIALGSNVGDRLSMIESACSEMENRGIRVKRTSSLYETKAMYLEDQQSFINGACEIETTLSPMDLLDTLKDIETKLGRIKTVENGPRTVDLDILMYDKETIDNDRLSIPHKRMFEREFVLRPLCDLIPNTPLPLPNAITTFQEELDYLVKPEEHLSPLTPLSAHLNLISSRSPTRSTHIMAIMNLTPDSFSDGGLYSTNSTISFLPTLQAYLTQHNPITILDIGGQSTRPQATPISPAEELSRILPTIHAIRADPSFNKLALSVDTYRASVAATAVSAGVDIINDVSAGQLDPDMLPTIARLGCTCILMHMRGTPETMTKLTDYTNGIIAGVGSELLARVREAEKAGIRRWRIMLDPGIGFAKTQAQNLELLHEFAKLRDFEGLRGFPWVVGASRKGFVGKVTGVEEASARGWGTAATVAAAVQGGADVVRVHDVREMGEVVSMADAIWRG